MFPLIAATRQLVQTNCRASRFHGNRTFQKLCEIKSLNGLSDFPIRTFMDFGLPRVHNRRKYHRTLPRMNLSLIFSWIFKDVSQILRNNSVCVMRNCAAQLEYVAAYRIRRGLQILTLYSRVWDELPIISVFRNMKNIFLRRTKEILLATVFVHNFDHRIPDDKLISHYNEFDIIHALKLVNKDDVKSADQHCDQSTSGMCWDQFINHKDITIWKKSNGDGLFIYKLYARYEDVTAKDFFELSLDLDHRKEWDHHVVDLKKIDSEPSSNSDVIYWEVKWPKLFANRDYVYKRRYIIDEVNKLMVIRNESTEHPDAPKLTNKIRVKEYWSYIVIKPLSNFDEPGIEFSLTYYDNPGMHIPSSITQWITFTGMPNYLNSLRAEALKLAAKRKLEEAQVKTNQKQAVKPESQDKDEKQPKEDRPQPPGGDEGGCPEPEDIVFLNFVLFIRKLKESVLSHY